jgi:hypothetical protein
MEARIGWVLAAAALAAGWFAYGWQGFVLAITVIVFWLLLQFSRTLRVLRNAAQRPVGHVDSAVMLNARLQRGMRLVDVVRMTGSLGRKVGEAPERFAWEDAGEVQVEVEFDTAGRCREWALRRPEDAAG